MKKTWITIYRSICFYTLGLNTPDTIDSVAWQCSTCN